MLLRINSRRLNLLIAENGLKVGEFVNKVGLSKSSAARILNGNVKIQHATLKKIADFFNVRIEELIYWHGKHAPNCAKAAIIASALIETVGEKQTRETLERLEFSPEDVDYAINQCKENSYAG